MHSIKMYMVISFVLLVSGCKTDTGKVSNGKSKVSVEFNQMLEDFYEDGLKLNPLQATRLGDYRYNHLFPDFLSDEYIESRKAYYSHYQELLKSFNDKELTETERMSKAILNWECEIKLEGMDFNDIYFPIDQMWTINLTIARWASGNGAHPFSSVEDYESWLQRLEGYLVWMSSAERRMREGIENGCVLPKALIIKIIPQLRVLAHDNVEEHLFFTPATKFPETFSDAEKENLTKEYREMVGGKIIPAYKKLHQFVSTQYFEAGRKSSGINVLPNGPDAYNYRIKRYTTTNLTADEIFQIGLDEVARIRTEMEKVKKQVGFSGELKDFFIHVRNNKELMPFSEPQQVIDNFNTIQATMQPRLKMLFNHEPKAGFEVRRTEAFRERSSSAQYSQASVDGSRPGIFYVPIPDVTRYNTFTDEALFLHEAIPGHHYQTALTQENETLPEFRRNLWYSAYGEGWALYTESLGRELGLYTDPYQYFGMLNMEIHRAIRLVVDIGMHYKGWSREEAIKYSLENDAESEESIIAEIERYMANPGQALSYKIGQLKILELRSKAEKELGDKFDIREFHNQILNSGCVPLTILEEKINSWIKSSQ